MAIYHTTFTSTATDRSSSPQIDLDALYDTASRLIGQYSVVLELDYANISGVDQCWEAIPGEEVNTLPIAREIKLIGSSTLYPTPWNPPFICSSVSLSCQPRKRSSRPGQGIQSTLSGHYPMKSSMPYVVSCPDGT